MKTTRVNVNEWAKESAIDEFYEVCPECGLENELPADYRIHQCGQCGFRLLPCAMCLDFTYDEDPCAPTPCAKCPFHYEDQGDDRRTMVVYSEDGRFDVNKEYNWKYALPQGSPRRIRPGCYEHVYLVTFYTPDERVEDDIYGDQSSDYDY